MIAGSLTTAQFADYAQAVALIPFGAFEQHGPHLPLLTDTYVAESICSRVEAAHPDKVLLYPAVWFGDSIEHRGFAGTLSVGAIDLMRTLENLFVWLAESGLTKAVLYNAHGGNVSLAATICEEFSRGSSLKVRSVYAYPKEVRDLQLRLFGVSETHAGSTETSLLYALRPELKPSEAAQLPNPHPYAGGGRLALYETRELSPSGVLHKGEFIEIDPAKGEQVAQAMASHLSSVIAGFPSGPGPLSRHAVS